MKVEISKDLYKTRSMSLQLLNDIDINGDDGALSFAAVDSPSYAGAPGLGKLSQVQYELELKGYSNGQKMIFQYLIHLILSCYSPWISITSNRRIHNCETKSAISCHI